MFIPELVKKNSLLIKKSRFNSCHVFMIKHKIQFGVLGVKVIVKCAEPEITIIIIFVRVKHLIHKIKTSS